MRRWIPVLFFAVAGAALGLAMILTVKTSSGQRSQQAAQEIAEFQDEVSRECDLRHPRDLIAQTKCYQKIMVRTDI